MSFREATQPVNRPSSDPVDPGSRSDEEGGDPSGDTAGDQGGEAAGGLGRKPGADQSPAPGWRLAAYLVLPRPDAWAKAQIAPACFLLAASSTGHFGAWKRLLVLWLVLECLIYPARYQWNDIRGIEGDLQHAEMRARFRLPVGATAQSRQRSIRLSQAAAALRILAALLIGALTGLVRQVLLLG